MSNPYAFGRKPRPVSGTTTDLRLGGPAPAASAPSPATLQKLRCKLALGGGSWRQQTGEVAPLLRYRLRIAALIAVIPVTIFLVRNLVHPHQHDHSLNIAVQCAVVAIMTLISAVLWTSYPLSMRSLRGLELVAFGVMAAFFTYLHFTVFNHGRVLEWAKEEYQQRVASLAVAAGNIRWFVLIVLYGTFVPNTWKRSATVVGILAAIPLSLCLFMCSTCEQMGPVSGWNPFFDTAITVGLASAIAVFGSYKISSLQQEAVVARELGQYRLKQKLGSGGMGEVYLAEHMMLRRKCALKLIRPDQTADPTNFQRFEREVQAMATLTHSNTVEVYDYGHGEDGTFYYVMEYLPGLSLQDLVDKYGPLPVERAVHYLRQICSALQEAHSIGLIHRDIKPSNVIACQRGGIQDVAKLLDFGLVQSLNLAADAGKLTVQGVILGSPPFMAPEQALGRTNLDARTDIYSLGAVAYFLLTGQAPFTRETAMELLVAHAHEKPTPVGEVRPEVPDDVQAVIMRCLEKEPGRRFQDADSLEQALAQTGCADLWTRPMASGWWRENVGTPSTSDARVMV
jgi:serine/threonine-protein kinase